MNTDLGQPINAIFQTSTGSNLSMTSGNTIGYATNADITYTTPPYSYWGWWEPYREYHYHHYHEMTSSDKFETAFKIARKLIEKEIVKDQKTIGDFFKLMDVIQETL